jgi:hypothetical protein
MINKCESRSPHSHSLLIAKEELPAMLIYYNLNPAGFYVYAFLREDGTPYYIGKGKGRRWKHQSRELFQTPKNLNRVAILESNLSEVGALALERRYIRWYGRKDLGTGILHNLTDGGEGASGYKRSPEFIAALSAAARRHNTGRKQSAEIIEQRAKKLRGKTRSTEFRERMSKARLGSVMSTETKNKIKQTLLGREITEEHRTRIANSLKGKPKETISCPHCSKIGAIGLMKRWHFDNCKSNPNRNNKNIDLE